jgi:hypothetical protein
LEQQQTQHHLQLQHQPQQQQEQHLQQQKLKQQQQQPQQWMEYQPQQLQHQQQQQPQIENILQLNNHAITPYIYQGQEEDKAQVFSKQDQQQEHLQIPEPALNGRHFDTISQEDNSLSYIIQQYPQYDQQDIQNQKQEQYYQQQSNYDEFAPNDYRSQYAVDFTDVNKHNPTLNSKNTANLSTGGIQQIESVVHENNPSSNIVFPDYSLDYDEFESNPETSIQVGSYLGPNQNILQVFTRSQTRSKCNRQTISHLALSPCKVYTIQLQCKNQCILMKLLSHTIYQWNYFPTFPLNTCHPQHTLFQVKIYLQVLTNQTKSIKIQTNL